MKKLLLIFVFSLYTTQIYSDTLTCVNCSLAPVGGAITMATATSGGGGGGALKENLGTSPDDGNSLGYDSSSLYIAYSFKPTSSYTLTKVSVMLSKSTGNPLTQALTCYLYSNNISSPGTLLATGTATISGTISNSTYYDCNYSGEAVTSGTRYWQVLKAANADASNYASWHGLDGGTEGLCYSASGTSWNVDYPVDSGAASIQGTMKIYGN